MFSVYFVKLIHQCIEYMIAVSTRIGKRANTASKYIIGDFHMGNLLLFIWSLAIIYLLIFSSSNKFQNVSINFPIH